MITCQKCGKRPATTHIMRTVNGETMELALCQSCAAKLGYQSLAGLSVNDLFGSIFAEPHGKVKARTRETRCPGCGCSFSEISQTGKVGCAECYTTFYDRLLPNLERIHGRVQHVGKLPTAAGPAIKAKREMEELKRRLDEAVKNQDFEQAAVLRDQLKALSASDQAQESEG